MDLELFNTIRDNVKNGNNEDINKNLLELETQVKTLSNNKADAVNEIKKLKSFKHNINEKFGLEKDISIDQSLEKISEKYNGYKTSVDDLKQTTDSKNTELNEMKSLIAQTQAQMKDLKDSYENEKLENKMNVVKNNFRKQLSDNGITSVDAQDLAIKSSLTELQTVEDISDYAKSFAETHSYLTDTQHVKGTESIPSKKTNTKTSLKDCETAEERKAYYASQIESEN